MDSFHRTSACFVLCGLLYDFDGHVLYIWRLQGKMNKKASETKQGYNQIANEILCQNPVRI